MTNLQQAIDKMLLHFDAGGRSEEYYLNFF